MPEFNQRYHDSGQLIKEIPKIDLTYIRLVCTLTFCFGVSKSQSITMRSE